MYIKIHPQNPQERFIREIVKCLEKGGVIIYPTDTVYGLGCDISKPAAVQKIAQLKGLDPSKANFSFICNDLSHLSSYTTPIDSSVFRLMKRALPGPYTFILKANNTVPKMFKNKKKTVGIRVPKHPIPQAIVEMLGRPILTTSLKWDPDEFLEYPTDPEEIDNLFGKQVDYVIDGGIGKNVPSTVINCTEGEPELIREGAGEIDMFNFA